MSDESTSELQSTLLVGALQRPAMLFYVPVNFFLLESMIFILLYLVFGLWVIVLAPLHVAFIIMSNDDYRWVDKLVLSFLEHTFARNRGVESPAIVTFCPQVLKHERAVYGAI